MFPPAPPALKGLLFLAAFATGALVFPAREAHSCPPPLICLDRGEELALRLVSSHVDGVAQQLPLPAEQVPPFSVANDWMDYERELASASLYDPEQPAVSRAGVLERMR